MNSLTEVLLAERDIDVANAISLNTESAFQVKTATSLESAELLFRDNRYRGLILSATLSPTVTNSLDMVTRLRREGDSRAIVFTSYHATNDLPALAYEAGADAFQLLPLRSFREFKSMLSHLVRSRAGASNLRIGGQFLPDESFRFAGAVIRRDLSITFPDGATTQLQPKSAGILRAFSVRREGLMLRAEIMAEVWGDCSPGISRSLDFYLSKLRSLYREHGINLSEFASSRRGAGWWLTDAQT